MKFCRDCTVSLSLKGLGDRHGSVSVPLHTNDGDPVVLTASASRPDATQDGVLFIGELNGDCYEFKFPCEQGPLRVPCDNIDAFSHFDVKIEIVFDPAADENVVEVLERKTSIFARGEPCPPDCPPPLCYVICRGDIICGVAPFDYDCHGVLLHCDVCGKP